MSLYNMLFGVNPAAPVLLKILGITPNDVPRFRDCYVDGENIVIHTRTGGGNRDYYESEQSCRENYPEYFKDTSEPPTGPWNGDLRKLAGFLGDSDDDYDCTYADFRYSFPAEYAADLSALSAKTEGHTPSENWKALFASLNATAPAPQPEKE